MEFKLDWSPSPAHKLSGFGAFACRASPDEKPPSKTDLSEQWPVDRSQGKAGTCVAFATTAAMEYVVRTNSIQPTPLSQRFVYYTARVLVENQNAADDTGTHTVTAIQALKKYGAAPEMLWPYSDKDGNIDISEAPSDEVMKAALDFQVTTAVRVPTDTYSLKVTLAAGMPVVLGFMCYENLYDSEVQTTGVIPMCQGNCIGGHCVLVVGYDDEKQLFKFRNSWGPNWGDGGYGYLPYNYAERSDGWSVIEAEEKNKVVKIMNEHRATKFGLMKVSAALGLVVAPTVAPTDDRPIPKSLHGRVLAHNDHAIDNGSIRDMQILSRHYPAPQPGMKLRLMTLGEPCFGIEETQPLLKEFDVGYLATKSGDVPVTSGETAKLAFSLKLRAVTTSQISDLDSKLVEMMSEEEKSKYTKVKLRYDGGFNIPLLSWFGFNLGADYNKTQVEKVRRAIPHYERQADAIRQVLERKTEQELTLTGEVEATGLGFIPVQAFAYIKLVKLKLPSGKTLRVVNVNTPDAATAADKDGNALPAVTKNIRIE